MVSAGPLERAMIPLAPIWICHGPGSAEALASNSSLSPTT